MTTREVTIQDDDNHTSSVHTILDNTELRKNQHYIKYYIVGLTSFVNVFLPIAILLASILFFQRVIPLGDQRKVLVRILSINTSMFVVCHLAKVNILPPILIS